MLTDVGARASLCVFFPTHPLPLMPLLPQSSERPHKVSISEAHFCAMDIEPERKESRLLSMMDGFSRGLPRVVLKGARMEP